MYLALQDEGVFRSPDAGKKWIPLNDGLTGKRISAVAAVGDSMFIGTNRRSLSVEFRGLGSIASGSIQNCPLNGSF